MSHRMWLFAIISFSPVPLIVMAAIFGSWWGAAACVYMTLFTFMLDKLVSFTSPQEQSQSEFPAADGLSRVLAISHFIVLFLAVWSISSNPNIGILDSLGLFVATGLFLGQVSNSNAHELIHRSDKRLFTLGKWVYTSMLFGHHTSAHLLVHHRFAASDYDPNSAVRGESFYSFARRAWGGSARAGFEMESGRLKNSNTPASRFSHPFYSYTLGAIASLLAGFLIGGWGGVLALIGLASYAQTQLLLSDYVQHYGLRRAILPNGKLTPVALQHSWNAPHWMSSYLMLAAPRHSDHHTHPNRPYPALQLPDPDIAPRLPYSLPMMAVIALYPRLWQRIMDPRLAYWDDRARREMQGIAIQNALLRDTVPRPTPLPTNKAGIRPENLQEKPYDKTSSFFSTGHHTGRTTGGTDPNGRRGV